MSLLLALNVVFMVSSLYIDYVFRLMNQILRLTRNCLSFDFIGTSTDESTDDMSTVQVKPRKN